MDIDDRGWGRGGGRGGGGRGGGGGQQRCENFFKFGTCKFGDNCRYKHVTKQGGGGRGRGSKGGGGGNNSRDDRVQQSRDTFGGGGVFGRLSGGVFADGGSGGGGGGGGRGGQERQVCNHFSRTGQCRFGDQCRFLHEGASSSSFSSISQPQAASPFGDSTSFGGGASPFGAPASPFGAPSSPFGAAAPASPFGSAAPSSPFGAPSSPFGATAPPQPTADFAEVARQFIKFFYEAFFSSRRGEVAVLLKEDSCLTLNDQKIGGRDRIVQSFMSLPMELSNPQLKVMESHPTGPDMSSILILVMGSVQMGAAQLQINHVFVLTKERDQSGRYWISNMIQRWLQ